MSMKRDFLSVTDLSAAETRRLVERAAAGKAAGYGAPLAGKTVALLFEKPDCIVARVNRHADLRELAKYASVPVVNALSDWEHPCQIMADILTIYEHKGGLEGLTLAYVGDGNNVARSLCLALPVVGMNFNCASPAGYELDAESVAAALARVDSGFRRNDGGGRNDGDRGNDGEDGNDGAGGAVNIMRSPIEAVATADVVYTDVWASMGQESEVAQRRQEFAGYTVDPALMAQAPPRRAVHARYAGPLRRGSAARYAGAPAICGLSASAQQAARAEGGAGVPAGRRVEDAPSPDPLPEGEGTLETRF